MEKRWLNNLLQYHGQYDDKTLADLKATGKSQLFLNITRAKTNTCEARLSNMLFPTDDKNWSIRPTPVPELTQGAKMVADRAKGFAAIATEAKQAGDVMAEREAVSAGDELGAAAKAAAADIDEAKKRAEAMEAEMEDQLTECDYAAECRKQIRDACLYGTGVKEGPVASDKYRRAWAMQTGTDGTSSYAQAEAAENKPVSRHVDLWGFFPDMAARRVEDCVSFFERYLMSGKALRNLAKAPGFDKYAVRSLLSDKPAQNVPHYLTQLRNITGTSPVAEADTYVVWKYRGPVTGEEMQSLWPVWIPALAKPMKMPIPWKRCMSSSGSARVRF